jgi:hypothetical protein
MKEVLAPRLRELEENYPAPTQLKVDIHDQVTIDHMPLTPQISGRVAAATLAPAVAFLVLSLLNFVIPLIDWAALPTLLVGNRIRNLGVVLTLVAWLFTWVALHDVWHDRTISRAKLYGATGTIIAVATILLIPAVYRLMEM